jgi:hypothetical protein
VAICDIAHDPKLQKHKHPFSALRDLLPNIFVANLYTWRQAMPWREVIHLQWDWIELQYEISL